MTLQQRLDGATGIVVQAHGIAFCLGTCQEAAYRQPALLARRIGRRESGSRQHATSAIVHLPAHGAGERGAPAIGRYRPDADGFIVTDRNQFPPIGGEE
jgi:hypothetical protein